jgi:hypothetical protein
MTAAMLDRSDNLTRPPAVARVSIMTLRALRAALDGAEVAEIQRLKIEVDALVDVARWSGESL